MSKKSNQRADVFNPNNPAHQTAKNNTANQKNPNHLPTKPAPPATSTGEKDEAK